MRSKTTIDLIEMFILLLISCVIFLRDTEFTELLYQSNILFKGINATADRRKIKTLKLKKNKQPIKLIEASYLNIIITFIYSKQYN